MPPRPGSGTDIPGWRWEDNRRFTTRSAYIALDESLETNGGSHWRQIWRMPVPQRLQVFVWLVFHRRLLTNEERARRHLTTLNRCDICRTESESIEHVRRLETDSLEVTEVIRCVDPNSANSLLLHDILVLLSWEWRVQIRHISRCGNSVANKLVRMSRGKPIGEILFDNPPLEVTLDLENDMRSCRLG
ncbi:hypothetical protein V6N12_050281 [Hibiscus sabdariffa]|uniref:Reverse transcriptase zinc-binding domain-containing protein n=1 Tax=Hibiscus sabdariffa TaxID=183260 RepID=A0ABR2GBX8_9ROSI